MSRRTQPTSREIIAIMRLLGEVASHPGNPTLQRQVLIDGLERLIGATCGFSFVCDDWKPGMRSRFLASQCMTGTAEFFTRYMQAVIITPDVRHDPYSVGTINQPEPYGLLMQQRLFEQPDLFKDFVTYADWLQGIELRDGVVAWARLDELRNGAMAGFALHRLSSKTSFDRRQQAMMDLLARELRLLALRGQYTLPELIDQSLSLAQMIERLAPREKQLLQMLSTGKTLPHLTRQMGLSIHTTRGYLKNLYAKLGISGRDELMAMMMNPYARQAITPTR